MSPLEESGRAGSSAAEFRTQLEYALEAARMGYKVFPCRPESKTPLVKHWEKVATTDEGQIRTWWARWRDANIGAAVGPSGVTVLDVDVKDGKGGTDSLWRLQEPDDRQLPYTRVARTPSGGVHIHMAGQTASKNGHLGDGLDVKSCGGFVLMPGSWFGGNAYRWHKRGDLAPAPDWFLQEVGQARAKNSEQEAGPSSGWDNAADIQWAKEYLLSDAPPAIEMQNGDDATFKVACSLRDRGVSEAAALDLMEEFYNPRCAPPWPVDDETNSCLKAKIANAYRYASGTAGDASVASDFADSIELPDASPIRRRRFVELSLADLANVTAPRWLVDELLPEKGLAVVYGQPKSCKTFWALDLSLSIANGCDFHDLRTRQGRVTYVAAEGGVARLKDRVQAWKKARNVETTATTPWWLVSNRVDLTSSNELKAFIDSIDGPRDLIVIDTLARCMSGDENTQKDMSAFVAGCDEIRTKTRAAVLVVHHEGKDAAKGARGSNVLRGAIDAGIRIKRDAGGAVIVTVEDQRDGAGMDPRHFELRNVLLGGIEDASAALFLSGRAAAANDRVILDFAAKMNGGTKKELAEAVQSTLSQSMSTIRRRIDRVLNEGRNLAVSHDGRLIWLERADPKNKQSGLTVRVESMPDLTPTASGES